MGFLTEASPSLLWSFAGVFAAIGLPLLYSALFADRARGRKRCPCCWYDMDGAPSLQCSECGHNAPRPAALLRTRRRWFRATVACVILFGGTSLALTPKLREHGPLALVPNFILVRFAPSESEEARFDPVQNCWVADPISLELARRIRQRSISPAHLRVALEHARVIHYRDRWPEREPYVMGVTLPHWLGWSNVKFTPRRPDFGSIDGEVMIATCGVGLDLQRKHELHQSIGMLDPGDNTIIFDGTVILDPWGTPTTVSLPPWEIRVRTVPTWTEVFPPSSRPPVVTAVLNPAVHGEESRLSFDVIIDQPMSGGFFSELTLRAELLKDGKLHAVGQIMHPSRPGIQGIAACITFEERRSFVLAIAPESWTLKLIPDARELATAWETSEIDLRPIELRLLDCIDAGGFGQELSTVAR